MCDQKPGNMLHLSIAKQITNIIENKYMPGNWDCFCIVALPNKLPAWKRVHIEIFFHFSIANELHIAMSLDFKQDPKNWNTLFRGAITTKLGLLKGLR